MQGRLRPYTRNPHPLVDWYCAVRGCTRVAKQPQPAPPCPSHPHVRMKPDTKSQAKRR